MFFAGVDPSITNTGVVILDALGEVAGCYNSKHRQNKSGKKVPFNKILRYGEIADFVVSSIKSCTGPEDCMVGYEDYSFDSENKAFTIGELGGVLKLSLVLSFDGIILVEPRRLKKFATGLGQADKEKMISHAEQESQSIKALAAKQKTSDVCDAYFLAKVAMYAASPKAAATHDLNHGLLRERLSTAKILRKGVPK